MRNGRRSRRGQGEEEEGGDSIRVGPFGDLPHPLTRVSDGSLELNFFEDRWLGTSLGIHGEQQQPVGRVLWQMVQRERHWRILARERGGRGVQTN